MGIAKEFLDIIREMSALKARTEDITRAHERLERKLDELIDRLSRIEANYNGLRANVRNEILADIKADLVRAQVYIELANQARDKSPPAIREGEK